ncbi:hypothetical protein ACE193_06720 [Bernardetia sp. OM2101]|uniref:hypothetical protein n=1 Tax=Bernardetia sp. OM2101 TaxID=3344876 RepID=UPI0035CF2C33
MKNKIINSLLILISIVAFAFILKSYLKITVYQDLRDDYEVKYMNLNLKVSKSLTSEMNSYVVNDRNMNKVNSFTLLDENSMHPRDIQNVETARILYPLDSIIESDLLGKNWLQNRDKIRSIFLKASEADDSLKKYNTELRYDLEEIFKKDKLSFFEWVGLSYISIDYKGILNSRMGSFCMCFPNYNIIGIPSKQIVNIGDTVFIDWISYIDTDFIPQTYNVTSNYENYLNFESGYHHCRTCGRSENAFLVQEYQIPFSEIEKNKKWRSVFYFRNDKLEQDSVVLERELEF